MAGYGVEESHTADNQRGLYIYRQIHTFIFYIWAKIINCYKEEKKGEIVQDTKTFAVLQMSGET